MSIPGSHDEPSIGPGEEPGTDLGSPGLPEMQPEVSAPLEVRVFQWSIAAVVLTVWALVPLHAYGLYARWDAMETARARVASCQAQGSRACEAGAWEGVLVLAPSDVGALANRCLAWGDVGSSDDIERTCPLAIDAVRRLAPADPRLTLMEAARADALERRGDRAGALAAVSRLLSLPGSDRTRWLTARGRMLRAAGDTTGSLAALQQAAVAHTSSADGADRMQTDVLVSAGRLAEAIEPLSALLVRSPDDAPLHRQRAELLLRLGRYSDALPDLRWYEARTYDGAMVLALADAELATGRPVDALGHYRAVAHADPSSLAARIGVFHTMVLSRAHHIRQWMAGLPATADDPDVSLRLARAYVAYCAAPRSHCDRDLRTRTAEQLTAFLDRTPGDPRCPAVRDELGALTAPPAHRHR